MSSDGNAGLPINEGIPARVPFAKPCRRDPLNPDKFVMMLRTVLSKVGLNEDLYAGHSFRIGAATTAAVAGLPDYLIKALGRWSSDCYVRYVRTPRCSLEAAAVTLAGTSNIW